MALQFQITDDWGNLANYWILIKIDINKLETTSVIYFQCFKDQTARFADKKPVDQKTYYWNDLSFPFDLNAMNAANNNPFKIAYDKIKTLRNIDVNPNWPDELTENDLVW